MSWPLGVCALLLLGCAADRTPSPEPTSEPVARSNPPPDDPFPDCAQRGQKTDWIRARLPFPAPEYVRVPVCVDR